jgi:hypothetical protein
VTVGAWEDPKRTVLKRADVEVYTNRDKLLKDLGGHLNMQRAFLFGPATKSWVGHALGHGNAQVLMNWNQPIARGRLLEVRALSCYELFWQQLRNGSVLAKVLGK